MDTKFIEIGPISRIQLSATVILWIGVMIRDSLAAQVIVAALGNDGAQQQIAGNSFWFPQRKRNELTH